MSGRQELYAQQASCLVDWCSRLLKMTLYIDNCTRLLYVIDAVWMNFQGVISYVQKTVVCWPTA